MNDDDTDPERGLRGCGLALLIGIGLWVVLFLVVAFVLKR